VPKNEHRTRVPISPNDEWQRYCEDYLLQVLQSDHMRTKTSVETARSVYRGLREVYSGTRRM